MAKFRILLVENTNSLSKKINDSIAEEYNAVSACSYNDAIKVLENKEDVLSAVLLDLSLKEKASIKILEFMHSSLLSNKIPVIIIANDIDKSTANRCYALGATMIITAPFHSYVIINALKNCINLFRYKRESEVNANDYVIEYFCGAKVACFLKSAKKVVNFSYLYQEDDLIKHIDERDRQSFIEELKNISSPDTSAFSSLSFRLISDEEKEHWYKAIFSTPLQSAVKKSVIISITDAQETHEKEIVTKNKFEIFNIVNDVISEYFTGNFIVDLKNDKFTSICTPKIMEELLEQTDNKFSEMLKKYRVRCITYYYQDVFKNCTDYEKIILDFKSCSVVNCMYQKNDNKWFTLKIYKTSEYSEDHLYTLWIFEDATDRYEQYTIQKNLKKAVRQGNEENKKLKQLVSTDFLTGMLNESTFEEIITKRIDSGKTGLFMMLDGDGFKEVNDKFGHSIGDQVIFAVGKAIQNRIRSYDVSSRLHGDEFAIWIENTTDKAIAQRVATDINNIICENASKNSIPIVTISAGFTVLKSGDTYQDLYIRADTALYEAKKSKKPILSD